MQNQRQQGMTSISGYFNTVKPQEHTGEWKKQVAVGHGQWNAIRVKSSLTEPGCLFSTGSCMWVREKVKKMSGRVHSDCLFGRDEVGLKVGGVKVMRV